MTAITATPSATVPGSWDLAATGLPTYGASSFTPAAWTAGNASTNVLNLGPGQVAASFDRAGGNSRSEVLHTTTLPAAPRFLVAKFTSFFMPFTPLEVALSWMDSPTTVVGGLPYQPMPYAEDVWLNLFIDGADPTLRFTFNPLYPYVDSVGLDVSMWLYDAGTVNAAQAGTAQTAALPTLERTDSAGTTIVPISATDLQMSLMSGTLTVTDHGAAISGDVTWTIRDDAAAPIGDTVTVAAAGDLPLLSRAGTSDVLAVDSVTGYGSGIESRATLHEPIGRAAPILITHGPATSRTGTLTAWCRDYAAARDLELLLAGEGPHQLRNATHPGLDMRFYAASTSTAPDPGHHLRWIVTTNYTELS